MQDTAALLRQLHLAQTDVVGWSDGGIIGLMLAVHHADLVRRVVVSGANFTPDGLQSGALTLARTHASSWLPPFAPTSFRTPTFADRLGQLWGSSPTADELSPSLLAQVTQPVLVMAGEYDVIKRAHTQAIYEALPSAKLWILPATSHDTFGERAEWVNPVVLSFLDD